MDINGPTQRAEEDGSEMARLLCTSALATHKSKVLGLVWKCSFRMGWNFIMYSSDSLSPSMREGWREWGRQQGVAGEVVDRELVTRSRRGETFAPMS
jgi:hypothetical protein